MIIVMKSEPELWTMDSVARMAHESLTLTPPEHSYVNSRGGQHKVDQQSASRNCLPRGSMPTANNAKTCTPPEVPARSMSSNTTLLGRERRNTIIQLLCSLIHHHTRTRAIHTGVVCYINTHTIERIKSIAAYHQTKFQSHETPPHHRTTTRLAFPNPHSAFSKTFIQGFIH